MSPVLVLLRLVRFSPGYFALCAGFAVLVYFVLPIPLGLATRAFFDALADQPAGPNAWSAIALLVGVQLAEMLAGPTLRAPWSPMQQKSQVLLRLTCSPASCAATAATDCRNRSARRSAGSAMTPQSSPTRSTLSAT